MRRLDRLTEREEDSATGEQQKDAERVAEALMDAAGAMDEAAERIRGVYNDLLKSGLHQGDLAASLDAAGLKALRQEASSLLAQGGYSTAEAASIAMVEKANEIRSAVREQFGGFGL